jgi:phage terminase large subunit-like protein
MIGIRSLRDARARAARLEDPASIDEALLVVIYAADPTDDWKSEATWRKANPGLGRSKKLDYMRAGVQSRDPDPRL